MGRAFLPAPPGANARVSRIQLGVGYATPAVNDAAINVVIKAGEPFWAPK